MTVQLEIAAFDPASALRAAEAGADRIELCRDAEAAGLTPPLAWIGEVTARVSVPVVVMIRSHANGFAFTKAEHAAMRDAAREALAAGAAGIVWGALRTDGTVDESALCALVEAVAPMPVVFHRAFDAARDQVEALDTLMACGATRVLTSGGAPTALAGADRLAELIRYAGDELTVMPGGGIRASNVAEVLRRTGARAIHSGASAPGHAMVDAAEVQRLGAQLGRGSLYDLQQP